MRGQNTNIDAPIQINGHIAREVIIFWYESSVINPAGNHAKDIRTRIGKARCAFNTINRILSNGKLSTEVKVSLNNTSVETIILYEIETWPLTE